jgi:hypothetical protein
MLFDTFSILRKIRRDTFINVQKKSEKHTFKTNESVNFQIQFFLFIQIQIQINQPTRCSNSSGLLLVV